MRPQPTDQKTAVFSFGSLAAEEPRSYDMDEPTRPLPLIAGRFAGREWDVEELQREEDLKKEARSTRRNDSSKVNKKWLVPVIGAVAAMGLLIGSLTGQASALEVSESAAAASREIASLRQERDALRLEYAETVLALEAGNNEPAVARALSDVQPREDKATVLSVRRGHELQHFWDRLVDVVGESFP